MTDLPPAPLPQPHHQPWYVWAGGYLESAMKSWGVPTIFMLSMVGFVGWVAYRHGDQYIEAMIENSKAQAEASKTVAGAVVELTLLAREAQVFQERVSKEHLLMIDILDSNAKSLTDVTGDLKAQTKFLEQIRDGLQPREQK